MTNVEKMRRSKPAKCGNGAGRWPRERKRWAKKRGHMKAARHG